MATIIKMIFVGLRQACYKYKYKNHAALSIKI